MTSLGSLALGGNQFSPLPLPPWVAKLSKNASLRTFACGSCGLTGAIDQLDWSGSLLTHLNISGNDISGSLSSFVTVTGAQLQTLSVAYNKKLSFSFGSDFLPRNFVNLKYLDVSGVDFRIEFDRPDADFSLIKGLTVLRAAESGSVGNLAQNLRLPGLVQVIDLSYNKFTSVFPLSVLPLPLSSLVRDVSFLGCFSLLCFLTKPAHFFLDARYQELANCSLSGPLPSYLPQSLELFDASYNQFKGTLSTDVIQSKRLAFLRVSGNKLSGPLPSLGARSCLQELDLSNNDFNGSLPDYGTGNYSEYK
jgi:Leucine-rich repeat (LRR) protein